MEDRVLFVGPGRAGLALGLALWRSGRLERLTYFGRKPAPPVHPLFLDGHADYAAGLHRPPEGSTIVVLSVPDDALGEVAVRLAAAGEAPKGCAVLHLSGALDTRPLRPLRERGYHPGTLHPLQAIADPVAGADQFGGVCFAVSGSPAGLAAGHRLAEALGGWTVAIPDDRRPLYHAAAVLASNCLVGLLATAAQLMARAGLKEEEALASVVPLARGTVENLARLGPRASLTGPLARGDVETLRLHLKALEPGERSLYVALGRAILEIAAEENLSEEEVRAIRHALEKEA